MSDLLKRRESPRRVLNEFLQDESGSVDLLALAKDTGAFLSWMWRYKIPVGGALLALLHVCVKDVEDHKPREQNKVHTDGRARTITTLIEQLEKDSSQNLDSSIDEIAGLLARLELPTVREFMSRNYEKSDDAKTLNEQPWVLECLAHNALREAGSRKEIRAGGHHMVAYVSIARSMLRGAGFPYGDICAVVRQPGQFSWTFDKRLLDMPIRDDMRQQYAIILANLKSEIGGMTPRQAWEHLSAALKLDSKSVYYHHERMWSDEVRNDDGTLVFPKPPRPSDFARMNKEQQAIIIRNEIYYKMSKKVARFFARLKTQGGTPVTVGSHKVYRYARP